MKSDKAYTIIWKEFGVSTPIVQVLELDKSITIPYFIDGDEKKSFDDTGEVSLSRINFLKGILLGYGMAQLFETVDEAKNNIKMIWNNYVNGQNIKAREILIADIAADLRIDHNDYFSFYALKTGMELEPTSSIVKFDFCVDLYNRLERNDYPDNEEGKKLLFSTVNQIDPKKINPDYVKFISVFTNFAIGESE